MRVNVDFASYIDVIEFDPFLGENIDDYKKAFELWYYEERCSENVGKVLMQRSNLKYEIFDINVIIDWIKEVAPNSNVHIIKCGLEQGTEDDTLPKMCF